MNEKDCKTVEIINSKFQAAKSYRDNRIDKWSEIDSYVKHRQWEDGYLQSQNQYGENIYNSNMLVGDTSFISEYKRNVTAMIDSKNIKPILTAKNSKSKDETADIQKLLNLIIQKSNLAESSNLAKDDCVESGTGYFVVLLDTLADTDFGITKTKGRITTEYHSYANVFVDPRAKTDDDMQYFIIKENIPYEQLEMMRALYVLDENIDENTEQQVNNVIGDGDIDETYTEPEINKKYIYKQKNIDEIKKDCTPAEYVEADVFKDFRTNYNLSGIHGVTLTKYYEKKFNKKELKYYIYYAELANGVLIREEDLSISRMPLISYLWEKRNGNFYGMSIPEKMLKSNKIYNISESILALQSQKQSANKYAVVEDGSVSEEELDEFIQSPLDKVLSIKSQTGRISDVVQKIDMSPIGSDQIALKQDLKQTIETISGSSKFATGQNSGSITTSSGVQSMISQATETYRYWVKNNFQKGYLKAVELILEYISIHLGSLESGSIEMAMQTEDGYYDEIELTKAQIDDARFDIRIDALQGFEPDVTSANQQVKDFVAQIMQYGLPDAKFPIKFSNLLGKYYNIPDSDLIVRDLLDYEDNIDEQRMILFHELYNLYQSSLMQIPEINKIYMSNAQNQQAINEMIKNAVMTVVNNLNPNKPNVTQQLSSQMLPQLIAQIMQTFGLSQEPQQAQTQE